MSMIEGLPPPPVKSLMPGVLSFVAGYVDGCTILGLFGLFVAQVTGSFVIAGAQLVAPDEGVLVKVLAIPVFFAAAVATTVMIALVRRHGRALVLSLAVECALLVGLPADRAVRRRRSPTATRRRRCSRPASGSPRWACRARWCGCCFRASARPT